MTAAARAPVRAKISNLNSPFFRCWIRHWSQSHPYHTRHMKSLQPRRSSRWWPRGEIQEPLWKVHSASRSAAKRQRRASSDSTVQPSFERILTTPWNTIPRRRDEFVVSHLRETGLVENAQHGGLPVRRIAEDSFEDEVLLDWVWNARRPLEVSILRVANKHWSASAFMQAAVVPARQRSYVVFSKKILKTLRDIDCYRTVLDSVQRIDPKMSSSFMGKKATVCSKSGFGLSFFSRTTVEIVHRGFGVLLGWTDKFALTNGFLLPIQAPITFLTESLL